MKTAVLILVLLVAGHASAEVVISSSVSPEPTQAPADPTPDCKCALCDCAPCNCAAEQKPSITLAEADTIARLEGERDFLENLQPAKQKASANPNIIVTQNGVRRYEIIGYTLDCSNGRQCKPVARYGWRIYPANPKREPAIVPMKRVTNVRYANQYAAPVPDGPTNATVQQTVSDEAYYPTQGPYVAPYAVQASNGCSAGNGCGGASGGCAGERSGILGVRGRIRSRRGG